VRPRFGRKFAALWSLYEVWGFTANPPITEAIADVAQLGRASAFQAGGHRFEACHPLLDFTDAGIRRERPPGTLAGGRPGSGPQAADHSPGVTFWEVLWQVTLPADMRQAQEHSGQCAERVGGPRQLARARSAL
jgi:hypothetical protein